MATACRRRCVWIVVLAMNAVLPVFAEDAKPEPAAKPERPALSRSAEFLKTLREKTPEEAEELLEAKLAESPDDATLPRLRLEVARRYQQAKQYDKAIGQYEKLRDYQLEKLSSPINSQSLVMTVSSLQYAYEQAGQAEKGQAAITDCLAKLRAANDEKPNPSLDLAVVNLLTTSVRGSVTSPREVVNLAPLEAECDRLEARIAKSPDSEDQLLAAWRMLMQSRADLGPAEAKDGIEKQMLARLKGRIEKAPSSVTAMSNYLAAETSVLQKVVRDEPEQAKERLDQILAYVGESQVKDEPAVDSAVKRFKLLESRIAAALKLKQLIGQPAPAWDVEAWAHGDPQSQESLKGKVVLVDFWAVWCGPCIATFPHLKSLHEEFHGKGLEIVGVTRQYGYKWNEETKRAENDKENVDLPTEQAALDQFLGHHELKHPTMIVPKATKMFEEYGVTGIPHAVVIDRQGVVRLIRVGSGEANAKAIHDMVSTLVAE
jgi:thiol-disulfide isomerase/thioredoxin